MDESPEAAVDNDDLVIIVENEAESLPAEEERAKQLGGNLGLMDTCPVCKLNFHNREPKLLPCLHSFCNKCLPPPSRNLVNTEQRRDPQLQADSSKPLNVIRCPVCRQECWEVEVLDNFFVKDSVEVPSSTVEKTSQVCMSCDDNTEATGFCVECVEFLCVTCIEAHQRVKFTRDHTIRQKEEMSPEAVGASTQKPVFCDIHKQEPLKLFCETCDRLTCRDCQLLKHKDHNYQFLEDAYRNHRQHLENMTHQLQEKRKAIEEVSNCINNGLQQVDENRKSVTNEIKKSICNLIMEINRKGKILVNQLETLTKDHEVGLKKQQEDVSHLTRHLDHVINFTKWATASHSGTALLYCKRLILCQIHYLMRANCNASIVPQSSVRFQCRSGFWASNVDLGSLAVERIPGRQPSSMQQGFPPGHPSQPGPGPRGEGPPGAFPPGSTAHQRGSTLAQLQLQVEKLAQHPNRAGQPPPNHWSWYQQGLKLPGPGPGGPPPQRPHQGGSPSQGPPNMVQIQQPGRSYGPPGPQTHPNPRSPTSMLQNAGFPPQSLRDLIHNSSFPPKPMDVLQGTSRYSHAPNTGPISTQASIHQRNMMEAAQLRRSDPSGSSSLSMPNPRASYAPSLATAFPDRHGRSASWKRTEPHASAPPSAKRRRRSSPGPIIVIKDEPEDDDEVSFVTSASLPDSSTGIQPKPQQQSLPPETQVELEADPQPDREKAPGVPEDDPNEDWCAVCQNGGELLCCDRCPKVFHLNCHIPSLRESPSGEWFCSFCRDLASPEMEYNPDSQGESPAMKEEPGSERFPPVDKRKCERLLLCIYCNEFSTDFQEPASPLSIPEYKELIETPMDLSIVKSRLESKESPRYCSAEEFVKDVRLIFRNCADTEVGGAGLSLEEYFEEQLKLLYQDRSFSGGREEGMIPPVEDEMEEGMEDDGMAPNEGDMPPVEDDLTPVEEGMPSMEKEGTEEAPVEGGMEEEGIPPIEESMEEEGEETSPVKGDSPPSDATEPVDPSTRGASSPNLPSKDATQPLSDTRDNLPCEEAPQPLSETPDNPPDTSPAAGLAIENEGTTEEMRDEAEEE
uniref:RING-type E3 ubiquitin transferase n=1 Tax=Oncorhynchus mykiss TaxID=8022 RepID=A0A8C7QHC9_ONCMY